MAQVVVPFSIPLLFMAGYLWPSAALPEVLRVLRWLIPSTAGILGLTQIAQMGASWNDVGPEVLDLSLLALGWGSVALFMLRCRSASRASHPLAQARADCVSHAE